MPEENNTACPWCGSNKIAVEGTKNRAAMVCQRCLARGPEIATIKHKHRLTRMLATRLWNARVFKSNCCGASVIVAGQGMTHWFECKSCCKPCDA